MPHIRLVIDGRGDTSTWVDDAEWEQLTDPKRRALLREFVSIWYSYRGGDTPPFTWNVM